MSRTISRSAAVDDKARVVYLVCFTHARNMAVKRDQVHTGCDERVSALGQDLHQVVCQIATSQVQTHDGVGKSVTLIDGHIVGHTITRV